LFPLDQIAAVVAPSGILAQEQLLELFKFVSLSDEKEKEVAAAKLGMSYKNRAGASGFGIQKESKILTKKVFENKKVAQAFTKLFNERKKQYKPKFALLWRGSRDGFNASTFHSRCDSKGPTFTVISVGGGRHIFGAYTGESWHSAGTWSAGRAWLYGLVNSRGKPVKLENPSGGSNNIFHSSSYGPTWGSGHDLHVNNSMKSASNHCSPSQYRTVAAGFESVSVDNTLLAGTGSWMLDEIEVFSVKDYTY
jgi:hypothetical protein